MTLFGNCGIDEYAFIFPVLRDDIYTTGNTTTVPIPYNDPSIFTNLIILYRIYLSKEDLNPTPDNFRYINSALASHYNSINLYNDSSDRVFSSYYFDSLFTNNGYRYMDFENTATNQIMQADDVLSASVINETLVFNFPTNMNASGPFPTMSVSSGGTYNLVRAGDLGKENPDYYFYYNANRLDPANGNNPDVHSNSEIPSPDSSNSFAFVAMFIIAMGRNSAEYTPVYSNPTLIHVMRLPYIY